MAIRPRLVTILALGLLPGGVAAAQAPRDTLRVVVVGDINLARAVARTYLVPGRGAEIFAAVRGALHAADLAVGNLESLVLDRGTLTDTAYSPVFAAPRPAAALLRDAGFAVVGTANNHAWDFERAGLLESLAHLDSAGVAHTGTGPSVEDALRPAVVRRRGWTIAIFAVTAIFNYPDLVVRGHAAECCVAWADTSRLREAFAAARSAGADLVLVLLHAGLEYRAVPPRDVVAVARGLVRAGADAVFGAHPHVPQGLEWVDGKPILYSLGNLVFVQHRPWTNRGLWVEYLVAPDGRATVQLRPVVAAARPRFATGRDSAAVMRHVRAVSDSLAALPQARGRRNVAPRPNAPRRIR
jgi:poly-gamma-glutamate capsule biosynthesis protein CapA/YwtB (metallophosphatase superfamily)